MMQSSIQIALTGSSLSQEVPPISTVIEVPKTGPFLMDRFELDALTAKHEVIRVALSETCEALMRQAAEIIVANQGGVVKEHRTSYRVDGEVGHFSFPTYAVWRGRR